MFTKQVKRKCGVRGCKNTECFAISRTREVGNSIIICESCLGESLRAIGEIDPKTKSNTPAIDNATAPPLFFNEKALGTESVETKVDDVSPVTPESGQENITPPADDKTDTDGTTYPEGATEFKCPNCSKEFDNEKGLKTHIRYCKPQTDKT